MLVSIDTNEKPPSPQLDSLIFWATQADIMYPANTGVTSPSTRNCSFGSSMLFWTVSFDAQSFVILKSGLKGEMPELRIFIDQHVHIVIVLKFWESQIALPRQSFPYNFPLPLSCAFCDNIQWPSASWNLTIAPELQIHISELVPVNSTSQIWKPSLSMGAQNWSHWLDQIFASSTHWL